MLHNQAHSGNGTPPPAPDPEGTIPGGAPCDEDHLASLEKKLQVVRDRTRGVVEGYATGLHVWGDGGIGKSFTVLGELERLQADADAARLDQEGYCAHEPERVARDAGRVAAHRDELVVRAVARGVVPEAGEPVSFPRHFERRPARVAETHSGHIRALRRHCG